MTGEPAAGTGELLFTHHYPNGTGGPSSCTSVPPSGTITDAIQAVPCTASLYPATSSGTATDALSDVGTAPAAAVSQRVSVGSCGPVQLSDGAGGGTDPMLPRGHTVFGEAGPLAGGDAIGLDGSTAFAGDVQASDPGAALGASFTEGVWFKVPSGYSHGGALMGFGSNPTDGTESGYDRILWMTTTGTVRFGIDGPLGATDVVTSAGTYNDGRWHLAIATVTGLVLEVPTLYVSTGTSVASTSGAGVTALVGYSGYWHVGWDQLSPQWDTTASPFLGGEVADAFVIGGTAASSSQVATLASEASQAGWQSEVSALGATDAWSLGGSGTSTDASAPYGLAEPVCSYVDVAWSFSNPSGALPTTTLATFAAGSGYGVPTPAAGTVEEVTITLSHDPSYTGAAANDLPGLIIYAPVTISMAVGSSPWHSSFTWAAAETPTSATSSFLM